MACVWSVHHHDLLHPTRTIDSRAVLKGSLQIWYVGGLKQNLVTQSKYFTTGKVYLCWETVVSMWALHEVRIAMRMLARTMHTMSVSPTCRHCRAVHVSAAVSCGYTGVIDNVDIILK